MKIAIIGCGGHAAVVADILLRMREAGDRVELVAFVQDEPWVGVSPLLSVKVVSGGLGALKALAHDGVVVAIGDNATRRRISTELRRGGTLLAIARHPSSVVAPDVELGPGTVICAGAVINPASRIGCAVIVNTNSSVDHHNHIGDFAHVAPGVHLGGAVSVGEETMIGIGSTVLPAIRIGARVVVGAGSVVTKNLPDGVVALGVPARVRVATPALPREYAWTTALQQ